MAENETNGSDNGAGVQPPTEMGLRILEVQRQDKLWATDTQRRLRVLYLLKNWTVGADSFYTMLKNMDVHGNAMLKYVVDESLSDPMTLVDVQPQDCALKLNRVCLRAKNINPKLAGFCRVDGTRFVKTDALRRYQAAMNVVPHPNLFETIMWTVAIAPDDGPVLDHFLQTRSWAMFDFYEMRVRAPMSPSPRLPASRPTLAPPPPAAPPKVLPTCDAGRASRHGGDLRHHVLAGRARPPRPGRGRGAPAQSCRARRAASLTATCFVQAERDLLWRYADGAETQVYYPGDPEQEDA